MKALSAQLTKIYNTSAKVLDFCYIPTMFSIASMAIIGTYYSIPLGLNLTCGIAAGASYKALEYVSQHVPFVYQNFRNSNKEIRLDRQYAHELIEALRLFISEAADLELGQKKEALISKIEKVKSNIDKRNFSKKDLLDLKSAMNQIILRAAEFEQDRTVNKIRDSVFKFIEPINTAARQKISSQWLGKATKILACTLPFLIPYCWGKAHKEQRQRRAREAVYGQLSELKPTPNPVTTVNYRDDWTQQTRPNGPSKVYFLINPADGTVTGPILPTEGREP